MQLLRGFLAVLLLLPGASPLAADSAEIRRAIESFLQTQTRDLPGNPVPVIGKIDVDRLTDACGSPAVSMNGPRRWGATQVLVTCPGGNRKFYVQVEIPVVAEYLVAARNLAAGQRLTDADVAGQLGKLPNEALMDRGLVIDRVARNSIGAGTPLRADMFRQAWVVQQGHIVKVVVTGRGFEVTKEGRALQNAAVGQETQVRVDSATTVSGVARADGSVEVRN